MKRVRAFRPPRAASALRVAPRTRVGVALALARNELERERIAREIAHLAGRSGVAAADLARAEDRCRSLAARLVAGDRPSEASEEFEQ